MAGDLYQFMPAEQQEFENIMVPMAVYYVAGGAAQLVVASEGTCRLLGGDRETVIKCLSDQTGKFLHADDVTRVLAARKYAYCHPEETYKLTYRIRKIHTQEYAWLTVLGAAKRIADEKFLVYISYFDATLEQCRKLEEQQSHRRINVLLQKILSTTQTALFWKDADRRFLGANKAFLEYYGFQSEQDILGKNDEEMGWHTEPDSYKNDEYRVIKNGESTYRVHGKCMSHGENRDIVASKSPMYEDGKIIGLVGSFEDVTEDYRRQREIEKLNHLLLKALDEASRANRAKSDFLSNISHDMRTPLNGILGFTELAIQTGDSVKRQDYLEKIKSSGCFLRDLINDTLELSRIENGKKSLQPESVPATELFASVVNAVRGVAEAKKIDFVVDTKALQTKCLCVDRISIEKILLNLLSNAIKFTPSGGKVELLAEEIHMAEKAVSCRMIVRDNGIGMSPDFIPRMFHPFEQECASSAQGNVGTGLGLAIVKQLVTLMEGHIFVHSQKGIGTEFVLEFPFQLTEHLIRPAEKTMVKAEPGLWGKKILLCEDNPLNREIAQTILEMQGAEIVCAANGKEGVEIFMASGLSEFDAILMDIRMPVMDGLQAAAEIRSLKREDAKKVPIIALSANAFVEDVQKSKMAGMDDHLTKPIEPKILVRTLLSWLK